MLTPNAGPRPSRSPATRRQCRGAGPHESLLDHTARREDEPVLGLIEDASEIGLSALERWKRGGEAHLTEHLRDETGKSESSIRNALSAEPDPATQDRIHSRPAQGRM